MVYTKQIYSPKTLREQLLFSEETQASVAAHREAAQSIFLRKDPRIPLIVGPCSIHNVESAIKYAELLKNLSDKVSDKCFLVMRVYVEKPRTTIGWKGLLYDPYLNGSDDILQGIKISRELMIKIAEIGLPIATEFLNPLTAYYYHDLISWGFIGARTSASQVHRELASLLPIPIGFKNLTDGNVAIPINSIIASRTSHSFIGIDNEGYLSMIQSTGNPYSHLVLRGSDTSYNYDRQSILSSIAQQNNSGLHSPIIVDCSHGNSQKNPEMQEVVFKEVLDHIELGIGDILGMMLESNILSGAQSFELGSTFNNDQSITDACLSFEETEKLVLFAYKALSIEAPEEKDLVFSGSP